MATAFVTVDDEEQLHDLEDVAEEEEVEEYENARETATTPQPNHHADATPQATGHQVHHTDHGGHHHAAPPHGHHIGHPRRTSSFLLMPRKSLISRHPSVSRRSSMITGHGSRLMHRKSRTTTVDSVDSTDSIKSGKSDPETLTESLAFRNMSRRKRFILISLSIASFTSYLSVSILGPFFPNEASNRGCSATVTGFIFGTYAFVNFIMSPIWGRLQERIGPRFMFLMGMFVAACCDVLFGFLYLVPNGTPFIVCCFAVRTVEALGASAFITSSFSLVISEFPKNIGAVVGALETFTGIGMIVGPAIGGALYGLGGFGAPFWAIGSFNMGVCLPLNAFFLPDRMSVRRERDVNEKPKNFSVLALFRQPAIVLLCTATCVSSAVWGFLDPTMQPHLKEFNLTSEVIGLLFLASSIAYAIMTPVWGWLVDRVDDSKILVVVGILASSLCMFFIGPSPLLPFGNILWVNVVCMVVVGGTNGLSLIPTFDQIINYSTAMGLPDNFATFGFVSGVYRASFSLGEFLGPSFAGALVDAITFPVATSAFAALAAVVGVALTVFVLVEKWERSRAGVVWEQQSADNKEKIGVDTIQDTFPHYYQ